METIVKIANVLEVSVDSLLFADLNNKSGNTHFVNKIAELTENFTQHEKELKLRNIEIFKDFKENKDNS